MSKCDILILSYSFQGRDIEALIPLAFYLEKILGYDVKIRPVFDLYYLHKYKPRILLPNGAIGSSFTLNAARYAKEIGIPVVTLTGEGIFQEKNIKGFVWGWNKEKKPVADLWFVWSKRALSLSLKYYPYLKNSMRVGGGVGFDRYKIYKFIDKEDFLKKYRKEKYRKIIGYACWSFDKIFDNNKRGEDSRCIHQIKNIDYIVLKKTLKNLIQENKEILFLLKRHPGEINSEYNEIDSSLENYDNVLIFKEGEKIGDLLNVSDIWMSYESTTNIEAWLLGKETIIFMPSGAKNRTTNIFKGCAVAKDDVQCQKLIDEFYSKGGMIEFKTNERYRKKVIEDYIQWGDGKNAIRTVKEIHKFIKQLPEHKRIKISNKEYLKKLIKHILYNLYKYFAKIPVFRVHRRPIYYCKQKYIKRLKEEYYPQLEKFYNNVEEEFKLK